MPKLTTFAELRLAQARVAEPIAPIASLMEVAPAPAGATPAIGETDAAAPALAPDAAPIPLPPGSVRAALAARDAPPAADVSTPGVALPAPALAAPALAAPALAAAPAVFGGAQAAIAALFEDINLRNRSLRAFVALDEERAMIDAARIDALRAIGAPLGPLAGMPIAIKDIIDVAGLPTKGGSRTRAQAPEAMRDADCVARLRAVGAIIVGKTATVEYAFGGWGTNDMGGAPRNPRDMINVRVTGGSSSGSGVAVAAGLVPAALGTDTGGSVRLPASFCGIVGLKTTPGLIDKTGVLPLTPMLDTIGPMTACVADAAALLGVLAPPRDERKPGWTRRLAAIADGRVPGLDGLRIGVVANLGAPVAGDVAAAMRRTVAMLEKLGAIASEVDLPETVAAFAAPCGELMAVEGYRLYGSFAEAVPNLIGASVSARMLAGALVPGHRLMAIFAHREARMRAMAMIFERFDVLVTPTTAFSAPTVAEHVEAESPAVFTRFVNYLDLCALSLPMASTPAGLPLAIQIVAPGFQEPIALAVGAALEAAIGPLPFNEAPAPL